MRRKPIKHRVKTHKRNGRTVKSYQRGKGKSSKVVSKRKIINDEGSARQTWETYTVIFHYHDKKKEKIVLGARDSDDALNQALKIRKRKAKPVSVEVIDSIAGVASAIVGGLTQVVGGAVVGLGSGIKQSMIVSKEKAEFARMEKEESDARIESRANIHKSRLEQLKQDEPQIKTLVKESIDEKADSKSAKEKLKQKYPEIFKRLAFKRV